MKYVLAISGGVDSVALLDMVANDEKLRKLRFGGAFWPDDFVVAHFDHGIRADSALDADFVKSLANKYGVAFELGQAKLGQHSSEELAREKRYEFLRGLAESFTDCHIVTAHHQDDLLETIVINLVRGTGWRGLAPFTGDVERPLLDMTKAEIINYAIENDLEWREDSTNFSYKYLRNRVRDKLAVWSPDDRRKMLNLYEDQKKLRTEIELELEKVSGSGLATLDRYFLIMLPDNVAVEVLGVATNWQLTRPQLSQLLLFAKVSKPNKSLQFQNVKITCNKREIIIAKP